MSRYKVLKDNIKNVVAQEFEKTIPIITEEYEAKIRRQAAEITRLLAENKKLKEDFEKSKIVNLNAERLAGQKEAWELARNIILPPSKGGMSSDDYVAIFGNCISEAYVMKNYTYSEAAAKVAEWEKAKEEIKVGDVVESNNGNGERIAVIDVWSSFDGLHFEGISSNGTLTIDASAKYYTKTGRHIDIDGFLKQIGR